jgi:hypothetical protein
MPREKIKVDQRRMAGTFAFSWTASLVRGPFILMADTPIKRAQTYEALLADISSQFANLPSHQFEREIEDALRQLIAFLGFDRGFFAEFDDEGWLNVSCAVSVEGMEAWSRGPMPAFLSWYVGQLGAGNIISIESIDDFPPEATGEVEDFRRTEMHSQLAISLRVDGRIIAAIGFDHFTPRRHGLTTSQRRSDSWVKCSLWRLRASAQRIILLLPLLRSSSYDMKLPLLRSSSYDVKTRLFRASKLYVQGSA